MTFQVLNDPHDVAVPLDTPEVRAFSSLMAAGTCSARELLLRLGDEGASTAIALGLRPKFTPGSEGHMRLVGLVERLRRTPELEVEWPEFMRFFEAGQGTGMALRIINSKINLSKGPTPRPVASQAFDLKAAIALEDSLPAQSRGRLRGLRVKATTDPTRLPGWPSLDLGLLGLTEVPDWVYHLRGLQRLVLCGNKISYLDDLKLDLILKTLREIDLRHNLLGDLPHPLAMWPDPIIIHFERNPGEHCMRLHLNFVKTAVYPKAGTNTPVQLRPELLSGWPVISLPQQGLHYAPPWLRECVGLKELDLAGNSLVRVGEELRPLMPSLERLDLRNNCLWSLPDFIHEATFIEELHYEGNPGVGNIKAERLWIAASRKPTNIPGWPAIKLDKLNIEEIPTWLYECGGHEFKGGIHRLDLSFNRIAILDERFRALQGCLRVLDLSHTMLDYLPAFVLEGPHLEELYVAQCRLTSLPPTIEVKMPNLVKHPHMPVLRILDIRWNRLEDLPVALARSPCLESLLLEGNPGAATMVEQRLACLGDIARKKPSDLPGWPALSLASMALTELPTWLLNLQGLEELDLSNNELPRLPTEEDADSDVAASVGMMILARSLRVLHIDNNRLQKTTGIPEEFLQSGKLQIVTVEGNPGEHLLLPLLAKYLPAAP